MHSLTVTSEMTNPYVVVVVPRIKDISTVIAQSDIRTFSVEYVSVCDSHSLLLLSAYWLKAYSSVEACMAQ